MPNDTTPLLPPNPSRSGFYYLTKPEWTGSIRNEIWRWSAADHTKGWSCHWQHESRAPMAAEWAARAGYTLATRHRIPTPAELEAVHQVVETLLDVANLAVITPQDEQHVGPVVYAASGAQVQALRDAAAMLRAALGGGA